MDRIMKEGIFEKSEEEDARKTVDCMVSDEIEDHEVIELI